MRESVATSGPASTRWRTQVIVHQQADGHFGDPFADGPITPKHMAMLWGNGRLLVGLMEAHRLTGRADLLQAARRLGGFLLAIAPRLNADAVRQEYSGGQVAVGYICWTQIIEGLVALHDATRDARYVDLARQVAARTARHPSQHSHGYLTSLRGILRLHEATGDTSLLTRVEREWEELVASGNVFVNGAVPEAFKPIATRDEGCSEADWLRLNLALWRATGKARYLENAELTLFNEFAFNQFASGDFGHRVLTDEGVSAASARAWWCCTFHGLRAYHDVFRAAFRSENDSLHYDLPVSGEGRSGGVVMSAAATLGRSGRVTLRVSAAPGISQEPVDPGARVGGQRGGQPEWAAARGDDRQGFLADEPRVEVRRRARRPLRASHPHGCRPRGREPACDLPRPLVARHRRSRLAVVLRRAVPGESDRAGDGGDGPIRLNPASSRPAGAKGLTAPVAHFRLQFLPGGYPVQPQTALLRPIADQTSLPDATAWVFWFKRAVSQPTIEGRSQ